VEGIRVTGITGLHNGGMEVTPEYLGPYFGVCCWNTGCAVVCFYVKTLSLSSLPQAAMSM
jgi:hypothetical protein